MSRLPVELGTASRGLLLTMAMLIDTLGGGLYAPFELVYALRIFHLTVATAGLILSMAAACSIAIGPLAAAVADRASPARVVVVANCCGATGCALLLLYPGALGYGLGTFLLAADMRMFWAAFTPLVVSMASSHELESWFGRLRGARLMGISAGQGLSGLAFFAGQKAGLRLLVTANGVSFLLTLALMALVLRVEDASSGSAKDAPQESVGSYRKVLDDRINLALAGLNIIPTLLLTAVSLDLPVFVLNVLHLPIWLPGIVSGLITVTTAAGLLWTRRLLQGRRRLRNLELGAWLWVLACMALLLAPLGKILAFMTLVWAALLVGIGDAVYTPTADAIPAALAPQGLQGRYAAIHQLAWPVAEVLAPLLVSLALGTLLWAVLAALALTAGLAWRSMEPDVGERDGVAAS